MVMNNTEFSATHQPGKRGESKKTILFRVMRERSMLGLSSSSTPLQAEEAFLHHWAERSFDDEDSSSGMLLNALANKIYPNMKPCYAPVNFEFDPSLGPVEKASQVMEAASNGSLEPDIATIFIKSLKDLTGIEEFSDLKQRIEDLEALASGS